MRFYFKIRFNAWWSLFLTYLGHFRNRIYHTVRELWGRTNEHGSVPGDGSSHCLGVTRGKENEHPRLSYSILTRLIWSTNLSSTTAPSFTSPTSSPAAHHGSKIQARLDGSLERGEHNTKQQDHCAGKRILG